MNFCINPCCPNPQNSDSLLFCQACGSALLIEGRYRVTRILGSGGFGTTYEIGYRGTLKVLKVLVNAQPKAVELFQREAQNLAELNDPGIPKVETDSYFTFLPKDCQEPVHCLVMEKIEGLDLREYLRQGGNRPLDGGLALIWMTELINILHQVHQKGIIHRDIKPQNIMLKPDGRLTLIDFGGSIRESTGTEVATQAARAGTGTEMATQARGKTSLSSFGYTPMEQINGQTFPQSDFFALGRTFIYLLTAQDPTSMDDALNGVNHWRKYTPKVSPQLADLVDWMTALLPKDRPANTQEILAQLGTLSSQAKPSPEEPDDSPIPPVQPSKCEDIEVKLEIASEEASLGISKELTFVRTVYVNGNPRQEPKKLTVNVPAYSQDGTRLQFPEQGNEGLYGGEVGNVYVRLVVNKEVQPPVPPMNLEGLIILGKKVFQQLW